MLVAYETARKGIKGDAKVAKGSAGRGLGGDAAGQWASRIDKVCRSSSIDTRRDKNEGDEELASVDANEGEIDDEEEIEMQCYAE